MCAADVGEAIQLMYGEQPQWLLVAAMLIAGGSLVLWVIYAIRSHSGGVFLRYGLQLVFVGLCAYQLMYPVLFGKGVVVRLYYACLSPLCGIQLIPLLWELAYIRWFFLRYVVRSPERAGPLPPLRRIKPGDIVFVVAVVVVGAAVMWFVQEKVIIALESLYELECTGPSTLNPPSSPGDYGVASGGNPSSS